MIGIRGGRWRAACLMSVVSVATLALGAMYDIRDVCVEDYGSAVSLAPGGTELPLPPLEANGWKVQCYKNRLDIRFGSDAEGRFLSLEGREKDCDTAWQVRSSRVPVAAKGCECVLSFRIDTNVKMRLQGFTAATQYRSGICWYGADGRQCAVTPVEFMAPGGTAAYLRFPMPAEAVACEVQIGFDTPNLVPGQRVVFRDVRLSALDGMRLAHEGSFVSDVCEGGAISWRAEIPSGASVRFQYAAADDPVAVLAAPFRGPDGTAASFYDATFEANGAWVRYKAFLYAAADRKEGPRLLSVKVGAREDRCWSPFRDTLHPFVYVSGDAFMTNANAPLVLLVTDRAVAVPASFNATVDGVDMTAEFVHSGNSYRMEAPASGWTNGLHVVDVGASDCHGNAVKARRYFYVGEPPRNVPKVTLRDDGMTLVNGEPFFPIGLYAVCKREFNGDDFETAFAGLKAGGFNFAHTYGPIYDEFLAAAGRNGIKLWCSARPERAKVVMEKLRDDPSVLAWYLGDDTSGNTTPDELLSRESFVKAVDPMRISCQADPVGPRELPRVASRYADYVTGTDVFMPELYPVRGAKGDETDRNFVAKIIHDMKSVAADVRENNDGRPRGIWAIVQYFSGWVHWGHFPSREQLDAMTWAAVVHGAHGVVWYTYGGFYDKKKGRENKGVTSTPERWRNICEVATRLKELSPVLVERTPPDQPKVTVMSGAAHDPFGNPAVTCLLKRHGGTSTLIAVNAAPEPVKARFGVVVGGDAKVLWEDRSVPFGANGLDDAFGPFAVHVYQWREQPAAKDA